MLIEHDFDWEADADDSLWLEAEGASTSEPVPIANPRPPGDSLRRLRKWSSSSNRADFHAEPSPSRSLRFSSRRLSSSPIPAFGRQAVLVPGQRSTAASQPTGRAGDGATT